jgi:hypothetical protein
MAYRPLVEPLPQAGTANTEFVAAKISNAVIIFANISIDDIVHQFHKNDLTNK